VPAAERVLPVVLREVLAEGVVEQAADLAQEVRGRLRGGDPANRQCTSDGTRGLPVISKTQKSSPMTGTETL
jgi:hypothetical protein